MPSYNKFKARSSSTSFGRSGGGQRSGGGSRGPKRRGQYIHPSRFVQAARLIDVEVYTPKHQFADFDVNDVIKNNLATNGYIIPTPIQDQAIPFALEGRDVIGIASTGTGKTAAFAIPMINRLAGNRNANAIIIAPTRELAQQIEDECRKLGKGTGLSAALLIGGTPMGPQLRDLKSKPQVIIGTPGRIKDHIERGTLQLSNFNTVVLDEVDRMLDMGFINDIRFILDMLKDERQSLFFSATLDGKVNELIQTFSNDPITISLKASETSENVEQDIIAYSSPREKMDRLHDLLLSEAVKKVIVFDETQRSVERLSNELIARGFIADAIHGGKSQGQRQRALNRFKKNEITILVATDVAARGIDVADITHVINYEVPQSYDDYIHRIGRAGRAGKTGFALTFVAGN